MGRSAAAENLKEGLKLLDAVKVCITVGWQDVRVQVFSNFGIITVRFFHTMFLNCSCQRRREGQFATTTATMKAFELRQISALVYRRQFSAFGIMLRLIK